MVRFKNRWILVEFISTDTSSTTRPNGSTLSNNQLWSALRQSVISNFGDTGWGAVGSSLSVKYFSPMTNLCIIRVGREHVQIAWAAVTLLGSIEGRKYVPNVVHVSGTIKHAQLAAIEHNRTVIARYRARAKLAGTYHDSYDTFLESSEKEIEGLRD